jgi:hypothetical protein
MGISLGVASGTAALCFAIISKEDVKSRREGFSEKPQGREDSARREW